MKHKATVRDRKTGMEIESKKFDSREEAESWAIEKGDDWPDSTRYKIEGED